MKIKYIVRYVDDFNRTHITFAHTIAEVKFIKTRFLKVEVNPCSYEH